MNSGTPKGCAVPVPLVARVVLIFQSNWDKHYDVQQWWMHQKNNTKYQTYTLKLSCIGSIEEQSFYFKLPRKEKTFTTSYHELTKRLLQVTTN